MAFLIESAIVEKLVKSFLFASLVHAFQRQKHDLGDKKLVMMPVMAVHGRLFDGDFSDAIVIRSIQVLQFQLKLISFLCQSLHNLIHLVDLGLIIDFRTLER